MKKQKLYFASRRLSNDYKFQRMQQKHKKYETNKENKKYTYKSNIKMDTNKKIQDNNNNNSNNNNEDICECGQLFGWFEKHKTTRKTKY